MFSMVIRSAFSLGIVATLLAVGASASYAETGKEKREAIHRCLLAIYLSQRKSEAAGEFQALLTSNPNDGKMHFDYANFLLRGGNAAGATAQYRLACKVQAHVADYQIGLGNALMRNKDYHGAAAAYRRAMEIGGATGSQSPSALLQTAQQYVQQQEQYENYKKQQQDSQ